MIQTNLRMIYNPDTKLFEVTFVECSPLLLDGHWRQTKHKETIRNGWELTPKEAEVFVGTARKQLTEGSLTLQIKDYKINFNGVGDQAAFKAIVEYLEKVWSGYEQCLNS